MLCQQIIALLIEQGADVNLADGEGVAPLRHAKALGQAAIVALLEKADAHE